MAFVRCYTGTDGQSHFEDLDLLPPDMKRSIEQPPAVSPSRVRPTAVSAIGTMRRAASTPFSSPEARWRS